MKKPAQALLRAEAFRMSLGKRLRCARVALDLTQEEFAMRLGISRQTLGGYEKGCSEPLSSQLAFVCDEFGVDAAWLLTGDASRPMFARHRVEAA